MNTKFLSGFVVAVVLLLQSCAGVSKTELTRAKTIAISKEQFATSPFGFALTEKNFEAHHKKALKKQRYMLKSPINESLTDTIIRFYKGKTEIFFYKPMKLEAKLLGGNIYKPDVKLQNDISVGLTRKEFFWKFTDWTYDDSDSLILESPTTACTFTFVFSRDKLKSIHIKNKK